MNFFNRNIMNKIYNFFIILLSLIAVILCFLDLSNKINISIYPYNYVDNIILIFFTIDYFTRLVISKSKKKFFINNIFDLIAIIPFSSAFRATRLLRFIKLIRLTKFFRLLRLLAFLEKFKNHTRNFLYTNGLIYLIYVNLITITAGAFSIYFFEKGITVKSLGDSFWWSFVTATTVGYGDISPKTTAGRITAGILMIMGIGFISLLTGTISTYFINKTSNQHKGTSLKQNYEDLPKEAQNEIENFIDYIRNKYK
ncbi:potassium channel family protein [Clostridium tyrobutyricum]|uniref:potassium channel family protein n=1 Tax=Clostridium tyrobutyricum TaxID=1519 RepID=UPI0010AA304C|nr:potassium channel family protein [Clostridium tyrobutyricum]MBV4423460.1 potassium channel family protein [Clostridium tyrobutyricum]QCH28515.1 Cyclic nucleotide-gated potassium channel [Clostridium tyrobutyricum]